MANNKKKKNIFEQAIDETLSNQKQIKPTKTNDIAPVKNEFISAASSISDITKSILGVPKVDNSIRKDAGYSYFGKTVGDYTYSDFSNIGNYKIYKKDNDYYYWDEKNKQYNSLNNYATFTNEEQQKKDLEDATKAGKKYDFIIKENLEKELQQLEENYKNNPTMTTFQMSEYFRKKKKLENQIKDINAISMIDKMNLDSSNLTPEEYIEYGKDIIRKNKKASEDYDSKYQMQKDTPGIDRILQTTKNAKTKIDSNIIGPFSNWEEYYEAGKKQNELSLEYYNEMMGKGNASEKQKEFDKYALFNEDLVNDNTWGGQALKNANTQVEGLKSQGIAATILGGGGAVVGGLVGGTPGAVEGAKIGASIGYTAGSIPHTYKLEAGSEYKELIDMGVDKDTAKKYSMLVGGINAAIESGENVIDLFTWGSGGKATSKTAEKATEGLAGELINEITSEVGESKAKKWLASKFGDKTADLILKTAVKSGVSYGQNVVSEGLEEFTQEGVSILGERLASKESGIERNVSWSEDFDRMVDSFIVGSVSTALTGGFSSVFGSITGTATNYVQNNLTNTVNENAIVNQVVNNTEKQLGRKLTANEKQSIEDRVSFTLEEAQKISKENAFVETYKAYKGNEKKINEIKEIQQMFSNRNIEAKFDDSQKQEAFWKNEDGKQTVVINPKASPERIIQDTAVHELSHDIFSQNTSLSENLKQDIIDHVKTDKNYANLRTQVENEYSKVYDKNASNYESLIDEEIVAKYLGANLGTQEYINRLIGEKPNLAKRIYNWVKDKLDNIGKSKEYKLEKAYWKSVADKFEVAYNEGKQNISNKADTKFDIINVASFDENYYNNLKGKQIEGSLFAKTAEYVNNRTDITSGRNIVENVYDEKNKNYKNVTIYYKGHNDWKVEAVTKANDYYNEINSDSKRFSIGNDETGGRQNNNQWNNEYVGNTKTAETNDGLSNINTESENSQRNSNRESIRNNEAVNNTAFNLQNQLENQANNLTQQNIENKKAIRQNIEDYIKTNNIEYPTIREMLDSMDDYNMMDNSDYDLEELKQAQKLYREVAKEIYDENVRNNPKNNATFEGKPFWSGSVSLIDGVIEETHTYEEANAADFNHSMYFSEPQIEKMDNGENAFFWVQDGKVEGVWRDEVPNDIIEKIKKQIKINDANNRYSLATNKDSNGRTLTKEQQNFFKNSKVVDKDGNLIPVFRAGYEQGTDNVKGFFTNDKNAAKYYKNYFESDKWGGEGQIYEVYMNLENPLIVDAEGNWYQEVPFEGEELWTDDIVDIAKERGYDGVIIKNVAEGDDWGGFVIDDYVSFNPNQVKNIDNTTPTSNADIRYSIAPTGEMVDNKGDKVTFDVSEVETDIPIRDEAKLMVLHNLGENKMNGIMDLDGIPAPSLAITNPNKVDHNGFGEGTLIFKKGTINPENSLNEVYDRDVWSPTQPQIDYYMDSETLENVAKKLGIRNYDLEDYADNNKTPEYLSDRLTRVDEIVNKYVEDNNIKYETAYKSPEMRVEFHELSNDIRQFIIDNDLTVYKLAQNENLKNEYYKLIKDYYDNANFPSAVKENLYNEKINFLNEWIDTQKGAGDLEPVRGMRRYQDDFDLIKKGENQVVDEWQTQKNKREAAIANGLQDYLIKETAPLFKEKGIYNGKDYLTPSGNRRSFWQLHDEYNLENIVDAMTAGDTKGTQNWTNGFGQIQAQMANRFNSIDEIRNAENQIMADANNTKLVELRGKLESDIDNLSNKYDGWGGMEIASELIADFASQKNHDIETFRDLLKNNYQAFGRITDNEINQIIDHLEELRELPTDYFEAKPQRAVGLDEIGIGLIPQTWSDETKQRMKDKGIKYIEYDSTIPGERQRIEQSLTDYMFSITNQNEVQPVTTGTRTSFGELFDNNIAPIREDISNISNQLNNLSNQIETLQNGLENNPRGYVESYKEQRNENIPTRQLTEDEANLRQEALMNDEGYLRSLEEQANYDANDKFIKSLTNEIQPQLDVSKESKPRLEKLIRDAVENDLSADEINDRISKEFSSYTTTFEDEGLQDVKKAIRRTPLKVDDFIKTDIADYNDFRKSNFGKMTFTNSGIPVDVAYEQLASEFPGYFPNDIVNPSDQLQYIAEVANNKGNTIQDSFEPDYLDNVSDYITDSILNYKANNQLDSQASLDKDIQFDFTEDIAPTVVRTQESVDDYINNRDIAPVKQDNQQRKTERQKKINTARRIWREAIWNRNYIIDEFAKATGNKEITAIADRYNNAMGEAEYNIHKEQTDINGKKVGESLDAIWKPIEDAGLTEIANDYLFQKSNIERHAVGKGTEVPLAVSQQLVKQYEAQYPELIPFSKQNYKFIDNYSKMEVESGILSKEKYNDYRGDFGIYGDYTPIVYQSIDKSRYFDDNGEIKSVSTFKKSKGNGGDVNLVMPMKQAIANQERAARNAVLKNEMIKEIVMSSERYNDDMDIDTRTSITNLDDSLYVTPDGDKIATAYIDGERVSAKISDELYNELTGENEQRIKQLEKDLSMVTKPLQWLSDKRRKFLTNWSPTFLARNAIKDPQDAIINSKHPVDMVKNLTGLNKTHTPALIELVQGKTEDAQQFLALSGSNITLGQYNNYDTDIDFNNTEAMTEQFAKEYMERGQSALRWAKKIQGLNEYIELAPRFAEFKASKENGDSLNTALYNSREVTTNFGRGGYITKALNRNGFTFLNANVQGLSKVIRNLSGENGVRGVASVVTKGVMFAVLPAILNDLLYGSGDDDKDEDYEALPDYIKDNYYLIKLESGKFLRIPKGRILSVIGSLSRRTMNTIQTGENQFDGWLDNAWSQIGIGDSNGLQTIFTPITQAFGSKNGTAWYGGDIVPKRLQSKSAGEQTDAKIDKISNFIGETFNISPYKVNYVLDQYSGGIGDILLPMITDETTNGAETPVDYLTAPIKDAFSVNSTDDNKYAGEFYDTKDKLEIAKNSANATDEDVLKYKYMSGVSTQLSDLYKEKREVQSDTTLSNKQKYEKVQKIQDAINSLAKEAMGEYKNIKSTDNYSSAGDGEFYKNNKNEWTKVSDSDSEFTAGMTDTEKSSYFKVKNKINSIYDDYNKKVKGLSKNDSKRNKYAQEKRDGISQAIINSGLDDYSKAMIYSKYYSTQDKMTNVYNAGYDIDTYITAMNDLDQIRDKYSQKKGYSTEYRKKKTISYINSLNIEIPQKAMLIRNYYTSFRSYNKDIVNYVSNLDISYDEKVAILKDTGMTVNGNNVSWK